MIKVNPDGSIEVATVEEAMELSARMRDLALAEATPKQAPKPKGPVPMTAARAQNIVAAFSDWALPNAISFLAAIDNAQPNSVNYDTMLAALNLDSPKALGGRSAVINKLLVSIGFEPTSVYESIKNASGRYWKARGKLGEALASLKQLRAAQLL